MINMFHFEQPGQQQPSVTKSLKITGKKGRDTEPFIGLYSVKEKTQQPVISTIKCHF